MHTRTGLKNTRPRTPIDILLYGELLYMIKRTRVLSFSSSTSARVWRLLSWKRTVRPEH